MASLFGSFLGGVGSSATTAVVGLGAATLVPMLAQKAGDLFKNGVDDLTENLTERAQRGELKRAYGRDGLIDKIADILSSTSGARSIILVGLSGVGKTAILHELACRIVASNYRTLHEYQLLSLRLRKTQGDGGAQGTFKSWWEGGAKTRVTELLETVMKQRDKKLIISIDEIQDLLSVEPTIFDNFKPELAENIIIIAATTNERIADQLLAREGMARRFRKEWVPDMHPDEAVKVIESKQREFFEYYKKEHQGFEFQFEKGVAEKVVELSKHSYANLPLPERAIKFLDALCAHLFNRSGNSEQKKVTETDVASYAAFLQGKLHDSAAVTQMMAKKEDPRTLIENIKRDCFTSLCREDKTAGKALEEFPGLEKILGNSANPFLILQSESVAYMLAILSQWSDELQGQDVAQHQQAPKRPVYRCNVKRLLEFLNDPERKKCLHGVLEELFHITNSILGIAPLLVLEDFPARWLLPKVSPASCRPMPQQPVSSPILAGSSLPVERTLAGLASAVEGAFGVRVVPDLLPPITAAVVQAPSSSSQQEQVPQVPEVFQELLKFIEENRVPCAALIRTESTMVLERKHWTSRLVKNPSLQDAIVWLQQKYISKNPKGAGQDKIPTVLFALHYLKSRLMIKGILEVAFQIIERMATEPDVLLEQIFFSVLSNYIVDTSGFDDIRAALAWSGKMQGQSPFLSPVVPQNIGESKGLNTELFHLTQSQEPRILWISEESQNRRDWIITLIGAYMENKYRCFSLNPKFFEKMPPELEEFMLGQSRDQIDPQTIVILDENDLNLKQRKNWLIDKKCKIICFKKPVVHQQAAERRNVPDSLMQSFEAIIGTTLTTSIPAAAPQPAGGERLDGYTSRELDLQTRDPSSLNQVLNYVVMKSVQLAQLDSKQAQLDLKKISELISKIQTLYPLLVNPSLPNGGHSVDHICRLVENNLSFIIKDGIEDHFYRSHGEELGMSYYDILLLTDPQKVPGFYRYWRLMTGTVKVIYETLTYPFKAFPRAATTVTTVVAPIIMTKAVKFFLRRRAN